MIKSMTGFGRGEAISGAFRATVEVRSVNNRFCEVRIRLPRALAGYETEAQNLVKNSLSRGKIDVSVQMEMADETDVGLKVNGPVARGYHRLLSDLLRSTGIDDEVNLTHLLAFSDIFDKEGEEDTEAEKAWDVVKDALYRALEGLDGMRISEGEAICTDLVERLRGLREELTAIETRAPERVADARSKLHDRLRELFDDDRIDAERLELEIALMADRLDISEECVRLRSHFDQFDAALQSDEPVGRRLNFLSQEINREVNTIGSKANDSDIATRVISMKDVLEQIREQVSNVQ